MNINKRLKPNLVDSKFTDKITRTLTQPQRDYWKPAKNLLQRIYQDWIEPNFYFFVFLFAILLFLLCRYRMIQTERLEKEIAGDFYEAPKNSKDDVDLSAFSDMFIKEYTRSKEQSIEPSGAYTHQGGMSNVSQKDQGYAYPIYPYSKGGKLVPASSK
jgi:hypothetical protein